jgi:hypothetical protein
MPVKDPSPEGLAEPADERGGRRARRRRGGMPRLIGLPFVIRRALLAGLLPAVVALAAWAAGCGSSSSATPAGETITGPGLSSAQPPWTPEYAHLSERAHQLGLPPVGNEKFHIHAILHIYREGLLVPVPPDIGINLAKHTETSLHTHDGTGIIHMETVHPYPFTLGEFFDVWGVKLGPAQVGALTGLGGDKLHFYVNGKPLSNPAAYVMHNGDSIVIGYGADSSFPHTPSIRPLQELKEGKGGFGCSPVGKTSKSKGCFPAQQSGSKQSQKQ